MNYGDGGDVEGYAKKVLWQCGEGCIIKNLARIGPDIVCYTCNLITSVADGDEYDMPWFQLQQLIKVMMNTKSEIRYSAAMDKRYSSQEQDIVIV